MQDTDVLITSAVRWRCAAQPATCKARFRGVFGEETIESLLLSDYEELAATALLSRSQRAAIPNIFPSRPPMITTVDNNHYPGQGRTSSQYATTRRPLRRESRCPVRSDGRASGRRGLLNARDRIAFHRGDSRWLEASQAVGVADDGEG